MLKNSDEYKTITSCKLVEIAKVKGSRFFGEAFPAEQVEIAQKALFDTKKREYNATHSCSAWRITPKGDIFRSSDDGEPSGSAGAPILRQIDSRNLTNVAVIVTRYYGGTKLGVGGLVRAYGDAASAVLDACEIKTVVLRDEVRFRFSYDDTSPAMRLVNDFDAKITDTVYTDRTELVLAVRLSQIEDIKARFVENLAGRGEILGDRDV